jgi:hypothetical protein
MTPKELIDHFADEIQSMYRRAKRAPLFCFDPIVIIADGVMKIRVGERTAFLQIFRMVFPSGDEDELEALRMCSSMDDEISIVVFTCDPETHVINGCSIHAVAKRPS